MTFPFLFWGRAPRDWIEGANDGHVYEIRFERAPTPEQRLAVGKAFHAAMKKGPATAGDRDWLWAGPWAIFAVGEKKAGTAREVFARMADVARAMHEAHPVAEVVYWNARDEGTDEWDRWTREQAAGPSAGPAWTGMMPMGKYGRDRDASLGVGERDADFEIVRSGKKPSKKGAAGAPALKVTSVLPGVAGRIAVAPNAPTKTMPPGKLFAARATPGDGILALTSEALILYDAEGSETARVDAQGSVQLVVTPKGIAVSMAPDGGVRALSTEGGALRVVGETRVKKPGVLVANGDRVFYCVVASYFEISGWPA